VQQSKCSQPPNSRRDTENINWGSIQTRGSFRIEVQRPNKIKTEQGEPKSSTGQQDDVS